MSREQPHKPIRQSPVFNRLSAIILHSTRYCFEGIARLAKDAGVSPSAVSRIMRGDRRPSYFIITRLVSALESELGVSIDPREVFREDPHFPTQFPCAVVGCPGCIPPWAYDADEQLLPEFAGLSPGMWLAPTINPELPS